MHKKFAEQKRKKKSDNPIEIQLKIGIINIRFEDKLNHRLSDSNQEIVQNNDSLSYLNCVSAMNLIELKTRFKHIPFTCL